MTGTANRRPRWDEQRGFDDLGRPLHEVSFCVVDLETTGASVAEGSMITEIGAVKVRGGTVVEEFQTLVDPGRSIPPFIASLTGITDSAVCGAPSIEVALPAFLDFARGCVLVAHNAPFDVGFLRHFTQQQCREWPRFEVIDTVTLARRVLGAGEVRNHRLSTLATYFGASTTPNHRALADARATVDVLHGLLARIGGVGVQTLEDLHAFSARVSDAQRRKRHLADGLPHAPGVYLFRDAADRVLYVGTSKDLRRRVRSYFTASETRTRMGQMVNLAVRVQGIVCATPLEASIRELRMIGQHKPPFNRRSKAPERQHFVHLTSEPWPRLSVVSARRQTDVAFTDAVGPFASKAEAAEFVTAVHDTYPIRQCGGRLAKKSQRSPCVLAELGSCLSPCDGSTDRATYAALVREVDSALHRDGSEVVDQLEKRIATLAEQTRYEDAATVRDRIVAFVTGGARSQQLRAVRGCSQIVAARRDDLGRWEVHVIRAGRLAAAGVIPSRTDAHQFVANLVALAETPTAGTVTGAEETAQLLRWLELPGIRLVQVDGTWASPVGGTTKFLARWRAKRRDARTIPGEIGLGSPS